MYIYIHIPFCSNICKYCDFPKLLYDKKYIDSYLTSLEKEIEVRYQNEVVKSIYIGGGTPTSLDYLELKRLLTITELFNKEANYEFTIESNVEGLDNDKLILFKEYGVNRISLGVQSFNDKNLLELNRQHTKEQVFEVIRKIKAIGFENISIDYIYGINDNLDEIKEDMDNFLKLDIPHISCYSLIIEKNTIFGINKRDYIEEDKEYDMYRYINHILTANDYKHYEISNYSKAGYQSIHNLNYWNNGYYYGFGLGSVSYLNNYRITNTKNLNDYLRGNYEISREYEDESVCISNTIILGLRKVDGIDIDEFNRRFNTDILNLYNIKDLITEKKLVVANKRLFISPKYFYLANEILINFI